MMDFIFTTGIIILLILLFMVVAICSYMRFFPWKQVVLSLGSYSHCDVDINLAKIGELDEPLKIELKAKKFYTTLYVLFVIVNTVVGILLTSGFIQQMISPILIGWIGIITLIFTIFNFIVRPEEKRKLTLKRIARLNSVKRECNDLVNKQISSAYDPKELQYADICNKVARKVNTCLRELEEENY
jgi:small-conductance mechanosensitive channel